MGSQGEDDGWSDDSWGSDAFSDQDDVAGAGNATSVFEVPVDDTMGQHLQSQAAQIFDEFLRRVHELTCARNSVRNFSEDSNVPILQQLCTSIGKMVTGES